MFIELISTGLRSRRERKQVDVMLKECKEQHKTAVWQALRLKHEFDRDLAYEKAVSEMAMELSSRDKHTPSVFAAKCYLNDKERARIADKDPRRESREITVIIIMVACLAIIGSCVFRV